MKSLFILIGCAILLSGVLGFVSYYAHADLLKKGDDIMQEQPEGYPTATLAGGCFWCLESEFRALDGVLFTRVGYIGGHLDNPKYEDTHDSKSGHAEAIEITYDPEQISYENLLNFFFTKAHDPTQLNRQGVDKGTQYRSAIFPINDEQDKIAHDVMARLQPEFDGKIVTTIEPYSKFWEGESYHQQYYEKYKEQNGQDHIRVILKKAGKLK